MNTEALPPASNETSAATTNIYQAVCESMPLLQFIRTTQRTGKVIMSPDHPTLPNELLLLMPFYMNTTDPSHLGVWSAVVGELQTRVSTQLTERGLYVSVTTMDNGRPRKVNEVEGQRLADALLGANDLWRQQIGQQDKERPPLRPLSQIIERVLSLGRSN